MPYIPWWQGRLGDNLGPTRFDATTEHPVVNCSADKPWLFVSPEQILFSCHCRELSVGFGAGRTGSPRCTPVPLPVCGRGHGYGLVWKNVKDKIIWVWRCCVSSQ
ncbi:hypothetical protein I7I51_02915 [Histoplasma capsulatum]|uniref:Uncharacterized protein n=1 Tax=Ajellomyces capsulatus TaxID=5037 RepID=A0A8A1MJQ0_AJECA|nr:hypothetical protein I7I51_02915 [Histoplasma capsulatum]